MEFPIAVKGLGESNSFLRALWAQLRARFGTLGWQYTPWRIGQAKTITFGFASLGRKHGIQVSVRYGRKDTITALLIEPHPSESSLPDDVELCVQEALKRFRSPEQFYLQASIALSKPFTFHGYSTSQWRLSPSAPGRSFLTMVVSAFDRVDADFEYLRRVQPVLDQLASFTNCVVTLLPTTKEASPNEAENPLEEPNRIWNSEEWMDGHPIVDGRLALHPKALACLDSLLSDKTYAESRLRRADRHFREALRLLEIDPGSSGDVAASLLISALEAVSLEEKPAPVCESCGQPVHSISKRVVALGVEHLGADAERFFKAEYTRRSKFLHTGGIVHSLPLLRSSQPLLDPAAPDGCAMPSVVARPKRLLEFTGFILRRVSQL
jgi:hypothetical protein